jgi:hypothetical protein
LRRSFKHACEKAKIPFGHDTKNGIVFKDIRRTVKTGMVAAGMDKVYRDMILGHSLKGMDVHYIKPAEADLTAAMALYSDWLDTEVFSANVTLNVTQSEKSGDTDSITI